jgi:hypothetical protein
MVFCIGLFCLLTKVKKQRDWRSPFSATDQGITVKP